MEVILILSYPHDWIGVSRENAIAIMKFFSGLNLSTSQAEILLTQSADDWPTIGNESMTRSPN